MKLPEYKKTQLIAYASPVLVEGEQVADVTIGSAAVKRNGRTTRRKATILVTDRRVVVYTRRFGGYDMQEFAYSRIAGVDHTMGVWNGQLTLRVSGGGADLSMIDRRDVARIAQAIRDRMASANQPSASKPAADQPAGQDAASTSSESPEPSSEPQHEAPQAEEPQAEEPRAEAQAATAASEPPDPTIVDDPAAPR